MNEIRYYINETSLIPLLLGTSLDKFIGRENRIEVTRYCGGREIRTVIISFLIHFCLGQ